MHLTNLPLRLAACLPAYKVWCSRKTARHSEPDTAGSCFKETRRKQKSRFNAHHAKPVSAIRFLLLDIFLSFTLLHNNSSAFYFQSLHLFNLLILLFSFISFTSDFKIKNLCQMSRVGSGILPVLCCAPADSLKMLLTCRVQPTGSAIINLLSRKIIC